MSALSWNSALEVDVGEMDEEASNVLKDEGAQIVSHIFPRSNSEAFDCGLYCQILS